MTSSSGLPGDRPLSIFLYLYDLSGGGIERLTLLLAREFRQAGWVVTLILHCRTGELLNLLEPGLRVVTFGKRRMAHDLLPLRQMLRKETPDILLSSQHHNTIVAVLANAAAVCRTRVVICQHNALSREADRTAHWKYRVMPAFYRLAWPLAAGIVAVSRGVADDMARVAHIARERITVIHNPVVTDDFDMRLNESAPEPWLDEPGPPVFVNAGRLVPQKDHATLLRAFALVVRQTPARLLILGDGPERGTLERLAAELGIASHVRFLGFVTNPLPYYRRAAAFVLSSRFEGFGNVLVEAMACGTPVIATDCPYGPGEIVDGNRFGRLVEPENPQALADAFAPDLRRLWPGDMLRGRARQFTASLAAERYGALFRRVLPIQPHGSGPPRTNRRR